MKKLANDSRYTLTSFHGGENIEIDLITREKRQSIPNSCKEEQQNGITLSYAVQMNQS